MNKELKTKQIEVSERKASIRIVIEYRRESNVGQKRREKTVTVYSYERKGGKSTKEEKMEVGTIG